MQQNGYRRETLRPTLMNANPALAHPHGRQPSTVAAYRKNRGNEADIPAGT